MSIFKKIKQTIASLGHKEQEVVDTEVTTKEAPTSSDENHQHMHRHVDTMLMVKFWLIGLVTIALAYVIFQSLTVLYLILSAYIISIALESVIIFFWHRGLSRGFSIALAYILLVGLLLSGLILIVPFLFSQLSAIIETLVASIKSLQVSIATQGLDGMIMNLRWFPTYAKNSLLDIIADPRFHDTIQGDLQNNISQLIGLGTNYAQNIGNVAVSLVTSFFSFMTQFTIVTVLAVLFSVEKKMVMRFVAGLRGKKEYNFVYAKLDSIYKKLGLRLQGQLILCVVIGVVVFIVLHILGWVGLDLPNKGSLALIAGLTEFIPYLGPLLGGLPAGMLAFANFGIWGFAAIFVVYWMIQWLENNVLIPVIMQRALGISPLLIFICVIVGGLVMGVVGLILGVPIAVIISMIYGSEK